jgi:hypothetical protein
MRVNGTGRTVDRLRAEGIPERVVESPGFVVKRPEVEGDYDAFICRAAGNRIARGVKLADIEDDMDLSRIAQPGDPDFGRVETYRRAKAVLRSVGKGSMAASQSADERGLKVLCVRSVWWQCSGHGSDG